MPLVPHTLLGAALSLLLVFRTNSSFARFTGAGPEGGGVAGWRGGRSLGGLQLQALERMPQGHTLPMLVAAQPWLRVRVLRVLAEGRMLWGCLIRCSRDWVRLAANYLTGDLRDRAAQYVQVR